MAVALPVDFVAWEKILMNGYPVGLISSFSTSPAQKNIAMRAAKPRTPLSMVVAIIVRGANVEAFAISSVVSYILVEFSFPGPELQGHFRRRSSNIGGRVPKPWVGSKA